MNCGSAISDTCNNVENGTFAMEVSGTTVEYRAHTLVSQIISIATFLMTTALAQGTASFSENMIKGINALRCAFLNGAIQVYLLLAAVYYAARQFGQEAKIQEYINEAYPYICTCREDVQTFAELFGEADTSNFESCA